MTQLRRSLYTLFALALPLPLRAAPPDGAPPTVRIEKRGDGFQLLRDGRPYFVRGAGGDASKQALRAAGGNSIRTWGSDNLGPLLDEAQRLGLTVTVGIWLGHKEQGFDYDNADQVAEQYERARQAILRYRSHPALLMWGIGNEMEGYGKGDNAAVWSAVNNIAALAKKLDPDHPTMTVVAEIGGDRVKNIERLCPDIDIIGINSYGGAPSLPERYRQAGGVKPYIITEYGPPGVWESPKTAYNAGIEPSSTAKADLYRRTYERAIAGQPLCLGAYAFAWGNKQEATATWFGLWLPDGSRLGAVDALTELWTGKRPARLCPELHSLKLEGSDQVDPGAPLRANLEVSDPEGGPLQTQWVLQADAVSPGVGGANEASPPTYPEDIVRGDAKGVEAHAPKSGGIYRLFVYVRDGHGGAAVANVPFLVKGPSATAARVASLPLPLYGGAAVDHPPFMPSGYMGNTQAIKMDEHSTDAPRSGKTCLRADFTAGEGWGGVVWQSPPNDWGDRPGGIDLTGATRLTFWARGAKGGEIVTFLFGVIGSDKPYHDTDTGRLDRVQLTDRWQQFTIDLKGKNLTRVMSGFAWIVAATGSPVTFYLDDIRYQ